MDLQSIARRLAEHLQEIVPDGFFVTADGDMLWYTAEPGRFAGQQGDRQTGSSGAYFVANCLLHDDQAEEQAVVSATIQALDGLQDFVDEASHDPWPGRRRPPRPNAEIRGSMLHCWFEDGNEIVVACRPVPLVDE